jgi:NADH-quinone oxidoreductase subunit F
MNTEPKPIYGEGNPETHPLTWRLSKQEHVRNVMITKRLKVTRV